MDAAVPPLWEFLWARGIEVPPPPFMGPLVLGLCGAVLGPALALGVWVLGALRPRRYHSPWHVALWMALAGGMAGLLFVPIYYRRMARRFGLARWSSFVGVRQPE